MAAEILRKLTIKTCGGFTVSRIKDELAAAEVEDGQGIALCRIFGTATGSKLGQTDKGDYQKLMGSFKGVDQITGQMYESSACILPSFISDQIVTALASGQSVEFAIEVGAKRNDSAVTGYEYTMRPLIESATTDRMKELEAIALSAPVPQLPAPAKKTPAKKTAKK